MLLLLWNELGVGAFCKLADPACVAIKLAGYGGPLLGVGVKALSNAVQYVVQAMNFVFDMCYLGTYLFDALVDMAKYLTGKPGKLLFK